MAAKTNSSTPDKSPKVANKVVNVPNPDSSPHHVLAKIGNKITWKSSASGYPKFQLNFGMWNPFNTKQYATFTGGNGKPLELTAQYAGGFTYRITHIKRGGKRLTGTYGITVEGQTGPRGTKCPPNCG